MITPDQRKIEPVNADDVVTPNAAQLRMARAALNWSIETASQKTATSISSRTIQRMEQDIRATGYRKASLTVLIDLFNRHGIEFVSDGSVRPTFVTA